MEKQDQDEDVMNTCGHRNSERVKAFEEFPLSMCPACLLDKLKAKDEEIEGLKGCLDHYEETLSP